MSNDRCCLLSGPENKDDVILQMGDYFLNFERYKLTKVFEEVARNDLRETAEMREEAIATLRKLIEEDGQIFVPLDKDETLVQFLRPCKFYSTSAFELMKRFYSFKIKNPKLYKELLPSKQAHVFDLNLLSVLPHRDQHGRRIMLVEAGRKWKPRQCSLNDLIRGLFVLVETAILEAKTQIAGGVVILDLDGLNFNHILQFTPSIAKTIVNYVQDCIPVRLKGVHIVNQTYIFQMLFNLFKPFLREKLRNRIHFHGYDRESLLSHIDANCLPVKYGGDMIYPELKGDSLMEILSIYEPDFKEIMMYGYSENVK